MNVVREYYGNKIRIVQYPGRPERERYEIQRYGQCRVDGERKTDWYTSECGTLLQCVTLVENGRRLYE